MKRRMSKEENSNYIEMHADLAVENKGFDQEGEDGSKPAEGDGETASVQLSAFESADGLSELDYTQIKPYAGMPKEVLLQYSTQACYRLPREILFWFTVLCTLVLLAVTATIIALSPQCLSWWQSSPVYQIYPRSFQDSDQDGVGDLKGIQNRLDHFVYLNVKAVWISPFYKSPMKDFGYDVEDFREIDPVFGTMEDFDNLLSSIHDRGLKLIIDFIPNHTSDKHVWFQRSRNGTEKYKDYYIWKDCESVNGTVTKPPNNWVSVFGNSAWQFDVVRGQCYLHQFLKEQPDLNFRNADVLKEMTDVIRFWLEKGVDGLRMDAVKFILEAEHLRDEPQVNPEQNPENITSHSELYHDYTDSQVGLHVILQGWRQVMDEYSTEPGRYRFMVTESYDYEKIGRTMMYYGTSFVQEANFPFNFYLLDLPESLSGRACYDLVKLWMSNMPKGYWPNWVVGNHDNPRIASAVSRKYVNVINMLLLTLPGTPTSYYGEEIGMENIAVSEDQIQDPFGKFDPSENRDPFRSPMQWDSSPNAGFSEANKTWLPVHPEYQTCNVMMQRNDSSSPLTLYRTLTALRESELPLHRGWVCLVWSDADIFAYVRELDGLSTAFLIVLNLGNGSITDLTGVVPELPREASVRVSTLSGSMKTMSLAAIKTETGEGLVLEYHTREPIHEVSRFRENCFVSEKACYFSALGILYKNC
ncbi:neutral and basic amino acid transport protein rBAT [Acipenser ruthenus]|uniref:neutral and basic amino acid transport protein rBAT n=1 Tax=Acipenser ruthenus TaxID=7906 RepID=UPI00145A0D82|nr:neutral and basic amino acid transport protein rBAT [Acipenser ruthenus]